MSSLIEGAKQKIWSIANRAFTFPPCLVHEIGMRHDPAEDAEDKQHGKDLEVSPSSEMPYEEKGE